MTGEERTGRPAAACGTYAGYQRHRARGEPTCVECKAANASYVRARRATPQGRQSARDAVSAQGRALRALASRHPSEYRQLYVRALADIVDARATTGE